MKYTRVQEKYDWFYEFRPFFILFFGVLGLLNHQSGNLALARLSQVCGVVLIYFALKIIQWRWEYRRERSY